VILVDVSNAKSVMGGLVWRGRNIWLEKVYSSESNSQNRRMGEAWGLKSELA
jgi:hypothetical protein